MTRMNLSGPRYSSGKSSNNTLSLVTGSYSMASLNDCIRAELRSKFYLSRSLCITFKSLYIIVE